MKRRLHPLLLWAAVAALFLASVAASHAQYSTNRSSNRNRSSNYGTGRSYSSSGGGAASDRNDGGRLTGSAIIQYDPDSGSIIVVADDEVNDQIRQVIENLDKPAPQVLIKVLFLEVTHSNALDLGVEAKIKSNHGNDVNEISTVFGLAKETEGGFYKIIDSDLEATIHAIAENNKLEVLSRPSVLTRNNQLASITVGQEVPFITNSRVTDDGQTINTIQYSDVGIILDVTPHIAPERMVEMQIAPEISTLTSDKVPISNNAEAPVIAKRSAETRVLVGDGKTVVIGGMMGNNMTENVKKVPLLGDIPYLGALFRRTVKEKTKTELLIFLTPLVVDTPEDLHTVSVGEKNASKLTPQAFTEQELHDYLSDPRQITPAPESKPAPRPGRKRQ